MKTLADIIRRAERDAIESRRRRELIKLFEDMRSPCDGCFYKCTDGCVLSNEPGACTQYELDQ